MIAQLQRLDLDFRAAPAPSRWAGLVLAAVAVALCADVALSYRSVRDAVADKETRVATLERRAGSSSAARGPAAGAGADEIAAARDAIQRLATPWDNLFGALEAANGEHVALLAIEPEAKSGSALISAEGEDYLAALNYVLALQEAPTLKHVRLVKHELVGRGASGTVRFSVSVSWKEPK